jgi:hypothetical protein
MKFLVAALLIAASCIFTPAQESPTLEPTQAGGLVVQKISWDEIFPPLINPLFSTRRRRRWPPDPFPQPSTGTTKPQTKYRYKAKVSNAGSKTVVAVNWEYMFTEKRTHEVSHHRFRSQAKIKPGKTKGLEGISLTPPSPVINIESMSKDKKSPSPFEEQVVIHQVEYTDGTVWRNPQATTSTTATKKIEAAAQHR